MFVVLKVVGASSLRPYVNGSYNVQGGRLQIEQWNGDGDFGKW